MHISTLKEATSLNKLLYPRANPSWVSQATDAETETRIQGSVQVAFPKTVQLLNHSYSGSHGAWKLDS